MENETDEEKMGEELDEETVGEETEAEVDDGGDDDRADDERNEEGSDGKDGDEADECFVRKNSAVYLHLLSLPDCLSMYDDSHVLYCVVHALCPAVEIP